MQSELPRRHPTLLVVTYSTIFVTDSSRQCQWARMSIVRKTHKTDFIILGYKRQQTCIHTHVINFNDCRLQWKTINFSHSFSCSYRLDSIKSSLNLAYFTVLKNLNAWVSTPPFFDKLFGSGPQILPGWNVCYNSNNYSVFTCTSYIFMSYIVHHSLIGQTIMMHWLLDWLYLKCTLLLLHYVLVVLHVRGMHIHTCMYVCIGL